MTPGLGQLAWGLRSTSEGRAPEDWLVFEPRDRGMMAPRYRSTSFVTGSPHPKR